MVKYRIMLNIFDRTGVVMDEYRAGETNAVVLAGMCTALAVVLSVIGFYMPLISLVIPSFSDSFPPLSFAPSSACLA